MGGKEVHRAFEVEVLPPALFSFLFAFVIWRTRLEVLYSIVQCHAGS